MIIFKTIRWRNFLSTGNQFIIVSFQKSPTNLIVGSNGAGKSTILDALTFVLYNKPFRKIKKAQLINTVNDAKIGKRYCSPLRVDRKPSFSFYNGESGWVR